MLFLHGVHAVHGCSKIHPILIQCLPGGVEVEIILLAGPSAPDLRSVVGTGTFTSS